MRTKRITIRVLAGLTVLAGSGEAFAQGPKVEDILARKPIQANVAVSTPVGADLTGCRIEAASYPKPAQGPAPTGIVVKDAQGRMVRQFIDTTGQNQPNLFYYYLNGVESYREIDANRNGKPDQYRWLGVNGGKWGADTDEDGIVDIWYVLSPEELSQELFAAILSKNPKRLEALLPSETDLKSIGMPEAEIVKIRQRAAGAAKRLMDTANAIALTDKAKWVHLEVGLPFVTPADSFGGPEDIVKHTTATVLFEKGDGKTADVFQTGEMIQIRRAWRLIDGPMPGGATPTPVGGTDGNIVAIPDAARAILEKLQAIKTPATLADMPKYHMERAKLLEEIVGLTKGEEQQPWLKQVVDSYASAAEMGDATAMQRLKQWAGTIEKDAPKTNAASYAMFRVIATDYTVRMSSTPADKMTDVQKWWRDQLESYVTKFPTAEDAPEAMMRLAIGHEFSGKDGEAQAKTWYEKVASNFATHPHGAKALGAVKRLQSEGQPFALPAAQTLDGKPFSMSQLAGKPVIVYYWANWSREPAAEQRVVTDLRALAELAKALGDKAPQIVTVSLDDDPARAVQALNAAQLPGTHLHASGGLDRSPLAVAYGIQMVPHLFVLNKEGKVANRNAQNGPTLRDELEKLAK